MGNAVIAPLRPNAQVPFEDAWRFVIRVGLAAQKYGCTAMRLETFLGALSKEFGLVGVFRATPTEILFAMRQDVESVQRIEVISTPVSNVDLDKLARLGDMLAEVRAGSLSLAEATHRLDAIDRVPPPWGIFASLLGYALTALGLAPLLGGEWADAVIATLLSMLVYGMVLLSGRLGALAEGWVPLTSTFVTAFLAMALREWIPSLNVVLVVLSAVAIILPGYTVSLGAGELVAQQVVTGISNLMRGLSCLVMQIFGAWLGVITAGSVLPAAALLPSAPVDPLWVKLLFPLLLVGMCLAFQVSRRDLSSAVAVAGVAYLGILAGSSLLNANLGNLLGTILAVIIANLWSRKTGRPTSIVLIPAIVMLVSGSIGFQGLAHMAGGNVALGMHEFTQMFVIAMTIMVGVVMGNTAVRPEPTL